VDDFLFLAEGDRAAYYETSQWTIKQNKETLLALKKQNKELREQAASLQSVLVFSNFVVVFLISLPVEGLVSNLIVAYKKQARTSAPADRLGVELERAMMLVQGLRFVTACEFRLMKNTVTDVVGGQEGMR
jgi:hypothetical protein